MTHAELFAQIEKLVPTLPGWCEPPKASDLAATVLALRPNVVVEIGVFGGRSLIPMALACQLIGKGRVIGIDPWSATISAADYTGENAEWWSKVDHDAVFANFTQAVDALQLREFVVIDRRKSDDVTPPTVIDLLHIDGSHSEQAVRDAERYAVHVRKGGFVFTDDDNWEGGGPAAAVKRLMEIGFVPLYKCGSGTAFQRVRASSKE